MGTAMNICDECCYRKMGWKQKKEYLEACDFVYATRNNNNTSKSITTANPSPFFFFVRDMTLAFLCPP